MWKRLRMRSGDRLQGTQSQRPCPSDPFTVSCLVFCFEPCDRAVHFTTLTLSQELQTALPGAHSLPRPTDRSAPIVKAPRAGQPKVSLLTTPIRTVIWVPPKTRGQVQRVWRICYDNPSRLGEQANHRPWGKPRIPKGTDKGSFSSLRLSCIYRLLPRQ